MTKFCYWIFKVIFIFSTGTLLCRKSDATKAPVPFKCTGKPSRTTDAECPSHYVVSFNNSCYKFYHDHSFNRSAAQCNCESEYAHLVYIENKDENDLIVKESLQGRKYWIGLHSVERHLYWDNGDKVTFSNAYPQNYYAFDDGTGCYRLRTKSNMWLDASCEREKEYICEYEDIQGNGCPSDYVKLFEDSCYKIVDDHPLNRSSAKSACELDSAHLWFIESEQEDNTLKGSLNSAFQYWIGLWSEPRLLYWDDNSEAIFTHLKPQSVIETFNDGSGCYHVGTHEERFWVDAPCNVTSGYICEYELNM